MRLLVQIIYVYHQQERIITPVPRESAVSSLNHYHPVALTPILMKKDNFPSILDPEQYPYRPNRSIDGAICTALHSVVTCSIPYSIKTFLYFATQCLYRFLLCYNAVLMLWKGLATKTLGQGEESIMGLALSICFGRHVHGCKWSSFP